MKKSTVKVLVVLPLAMLGCLLIGGLTSSITPQEKTTQYGFQDAKPSPGPLPPVTSQEKINDFVRGIKQAKNQEEFTDAVWGMSLGASREQVIAKYGHPDQICNVNGLEVLIYLPNTDCDYSMYLGIRNGVLTSRKYVPK